MSTDEPGPPAPLPGLPARGSRSGRPVMALLDLLGRRWALRILWELRDGPLGFRALQGRCDGMSSSVLNQRLAELVNAEVLDQDAEGYRLSGEGSRLLGPLSELNDWAERWAGRTRAG